MLTGRIFGIKRMEIHDGEGVRTTVFFKGCPLKCVWCHNPEGISFESSVAKFEHKCVSCGLCGGRRTGEAAQKCPSGALVYYGKEYGDAELCDILARDKAFFDASGGGVTLSGGECLAQPRFAASLARLLRERGISVYVDTCGYAPREAFDAIIPYTDKFLYDIKAIDAEVHKRFTGRDNALILDNLRYLVSHGCKIEVRYPLVVGYNDGECEKIGAFLSELGGIEKIKVLKYHDLAGSRYEALGMENTLPKTVTQSADVRRAVEMLSSFDLCAE